MRITQFQTNFSVGELDPLLRSRVDLQQYQNALEEATNVLVQPQGGIKRRPGLEFIHSFGSSAADNFKLIPFEFSVTDSYLLVVTTGKIYVFKDGVKQGNINGLGNDYIVTPTITAAMIDELQYAQAVDTLILCHEDLETLRLIRNSDTYWSWGPLPITNIPKYPYGFTTNMPNFTITPSATSGNITLTASANTNDTGTAQGGSSNTITLKSSSNYTSDDQPNGMFITLTGGTGNGHTRHIEDYNGTTKVAVVSPNWTQIPDNTTTYKVEPFAPTTVGEYAQVTSTFGRARYVEFVSSTSMKAVVEVPFFDTSAIIAGNWESEHGYEDVWSSTRGWPRSATFHEGRLYFGGSKSRPNTIWGSKVIDYYNFSAGTGLDDESVEATINTNQLNSIVNIVASADLRIFTTGGEFVVIQSEDAPVTPSDFLVRPQTRLGAKPGVPIEDLNGASVFVQRQGKSLNGFQFGSGTKSYQVQQISVLSSHLIKNPVDLAIRRSTSTDEADRLFVVNGDDGSMSVYSILVGQNVIAPSVFTTGHNAGSASDGHFKAVAVEGSDVYVIVHRSPDQSGGTGALQVYLEKFDDVLNLDSALYIGNGATTKQVSHLKGLEVQIVNNGVVEAAQTVPNDGSASPPYTITLAATSSGHENHVGLNYTVQAKTMPAAPMLQSGSVQGVQKRVVQVDAVLNETKDLKINGKQVSFRNFGDEALDTAIAPFTGIKTAHGMLGYSATGQITLTQGVPLDMTVLGLEYKLSVGS
jgi:hypothetical protein